MFLRPYEGARRDKRKIILPLELVRKSDRYALQILICGVVFSQQTFYNIVHGKDSICLSLVLFTPALMFF